MYVPQPAGLFDDYQCRCTPFARFHNKFQTQYVCAIVLGHADNMVHAFVVHDYTVSDGYHHILARKLHSFWARPHMTMRAIALSPVEFKLELTPPLQLLFCRRHTARAVVHAAPNVM